MFEHSDFSRPRADRSAHRDLGLSGKLANKTANDDPTVDVDEDISRLRRIVDNIDISLEASKRLQKLTKQATEVTSPPWSKIPDFLRLSEISYDEVMDKIQTDALILFAMLGIPPEKARAMARELTGTSPEDVTFTGFQDYIRALIGQKVPFSANQLAAIGTFSGTAVISQTVQINLSQIEGHLSFSSDETNASWSYTEVNIEISKLRVEFGQVDPLILDLDGDGITTSHVNDNKQFDIDGDGTVDQTAWIGGNDALLALDRNDDGIINDGTELFGDQNGAKDGFAELAKYDDNNDGVINNKDKVFSSLVLLRADDSQSSLESEGIKSISLTMITPLDQRLIGGDLVAKSQFERDDGTTGTVGDVFFDVRA